jgi:hypothetical protein
MCSFSDGLNNCSSLPSFEHFKEESGDSSANGGFQLPEKKVHSVCQMPVLSLQMLY